MIEMGVEGNFLRRRQPALFLIASPVLAVAVAAAVLTAGDAASTEGATSSAASSATPADHPTLSLSRGSCGDRPALRPGRQVLRVRNDGGVGLDVRLVDARGGIVAEAEHLGVGATLAIPVALGNGRYAFQCAFEETDIITGAATAVTGATGRSTRAVRPVPQQALVPTAQRYQDWVSARLTALIPLTAALRSAVAAGDRATARRDWLRAHSLYQRLGSAYDAFGDLGESIDGLAVPGRPHEPGFSGFHRVERVLWQRSHVSAALPWAGRLVADVRRLRTEFRSAQIDPPSLGLRAHEILEDTEHVVLTGAGDEGSHSELATVRANLAGTLRLLDLLRPVVGPRYPGFGRTVASVRAARRDVVALRTKTASGWPPLSALTTGQREQLTTDLSGALELLAPVAVVTELRRTS